MRGFALLGILIINVQAFAMAGAAYNNPTAVEQSSLDWILWSVNHILADQKFMAIFSMLFGAGAVIFMDKARSKGLRPRVVFLRRLAWLFVFGLIHAYGIWHGDILTTYAVCGLTLIACYGFSRRHLWGAGWGFLIIGGLISAGTGLLFPYFDEADLRLVQLIWSPQADEIARETAAFRGSWVEQTPERAQQAWHMQTSVLTSWSFWRVSGMMIIGMSLYRSGFFESERSCQRSAWMATAALPIGLVLSGVGLYLNHLSGWTMEYSLFFGSLWNYFGSVFVAIGYMNLLILVLRPPSSGAIRRLFARIGRTAFSGYIFQSLAASLIFYGHGIGAFGYLSRAEQWAVVAIIWGAQILLTSLWLSRFPQGPLESLWRRLTSRVLRQALTGRQNPPSLFWTAGRTGEI